MKNKKQIVIATSVLVLVTILLLGLTYAYYKTKINGNTKDKSISVTSKKLEIIYADGNGEITPTEKIEPGYTVTKTFTVENTGDQTLSYSIKLDNITNTFSRAEDWTYVLKKGNVEVSSGTIPKGETYIINTVSIDSKTTDSYSLTVTYANLTDVDQSVDMGATLSLRVNIDEAVGTIFENASEGTLLKAIGSDNLISKPLTTPADESSSTNEAVLSSTEDDYGMSYYYRGNVKNNFVNFSGMCWRVVRVQGNGSIKIILADRDHECNASEYSTELTSLAFISDEKFSYNSRQGSSTSDDLKYETSDIKIVLETWLNGGNYTTETKTGTFEKKIDDTKLIETEWCNDMSISRKTTDNIYYGAHDRIYETKTPTLKCNLMGLDNTSAVKINSKIGLLTADEIVFAGFGSTYDSNMSSYLIGSVMFEDDRRYWTMSPYFYNELDGAQLAAIDVTIIAHYIASEGLFVRPALVLRSDITITSGNGTKTNPYIIK